MECSGRQNPPVRWQRYVIWTRLGPCLNRKYRVCFSFLFFIHCSSERKLTSNYICTVIRWTMPACDSISSTVVMISGRIGFVLPIKPAGSALRLYQQQSFVLLVCCDRELWNWPTRVNRYGHPLKRTCQPVTTERSDFSGGNSMDSGIIIPKRLSDDETDRTETLLTWDLWTLKFILAHKSMYF